MKLETILSEALSKIALQACRNGESGARRWPALSALPAVKSWACVGEIYAPQVAYLILEAYLKPGLLRDCLLSLYRRRARVDPSAPMGVVGSP